MSWREKLSRIERQLQDEEPPRPVRTMWRGEGEPSPDAIVLKWPEELQREHEATTDQP